MTMTAFEEIGHLSDIPVDVDVLLDRKNMTVREILSLDEGSVIIEETVGVRITDFNEED